VGGFTVSVFREMYKSSRERYNWGGRLRRSFVSMKQTILITGASSGFGKETVKLFHQKGWNVVATMRTPDSSFADLEGVLAARLDVTDKASIGSAVAAAVSGSGGSMCWSTIPAMVRWVHSRLQPIR